MDFDPGNEDATCVEWLSGPSIFRAWRNSLRRWRWRAKRFVQGPYAMVGGGAGMGPFVIAALASRGAMAVIINASDQRLRIFL